MPRLGATYALTADGRTVGVGDLRPLLGHLQRRAVLAQQRRRQRRPHHRQLHRPRRRRASTSRRLRPGELPSTISGTFPTANVFFAADLKSPTDPRDDAVARARLRPRPVGARPLRASPRHRLRRGLHHHRQRQDDDRHATASTSAPSTTPSTATATCRSASTTRSTCSRDGRRRSR